MTSKLAKHGAFLHIPKTGGTWVYAVLNAANLTRGPIGHEHNWDHYEDWAFTVVRNPINWWVSLWKHQVQHHWVPLSGGEMHPLWPIANLYAETIEEWIYKAYTEAPGFCGQLYRMFTANADYVLQTKDLGQQLSILASNVGWPKLNVERKMANVSNVTVDIDGIDFRPLAEAESEAIAIWQNAGIQHQISYSI